MEIIISFIHKETGWGDPLKPLCEFEDLFLREIKEIEDNKLFVTFEYHFDEDGFSMYPRVHILKGNVTFDDKGIIYDNHLEETFTGPACVEDPYKPKKEKP